MVTHSYVIFSDMINTTFFLFVYEVLIENVKRSLSYERKKNDKSLDDKRTSLNTNLFYHPFHV